MSSQSARPLRRERRAAANARRRVDRRPATREPRGIGIGLVSLVALMAGAVLIAAVVILSAKPAPATGSVVRALAPAGIPAAGRVLGSARAPVAIDLYEDFQCPACEQWG
ncbi:MAG: Thioredoxin, partial [Chloroflexota bacterium]|nr:Thioredoxin [Chloroflexota bacterium]